MSGLAFGTCEARDRQVLLDLCMDLVRTYEDPARISLQRVQAWEQRKLEEHLDRYTRLELDGVPVGYFSLEDQGDRLELDDFYVLPAFRGQGLGSQALRRILQAAEKPVFLYVFNANTGAVRLYRRFGFHVAETVDTRSTLQWEPGAKSI